MLMRGIVATARAAARTGSGALPAVGAGVTSLRPFSQGVASVDRVAAPQEMATGKLPADDNHAPDVLDSYCAADADQAKGGTAYHRKPQSTDHLYTNINVEQQVSSNTSGETTVVHHMTQADNELKHDLRDAESPRSIPAASLDTAKVGLNPDTTIRQNLASAPAAVRAGSLPPTDNYFPETMRTETGEYFADMASGSPRGTTRANLSGSSGDGGKLMPNKLREGFYPDTMLLENEVRERIPPEGMPAPQHDQPEKHAEGFFFDSLQTDPDSDVAARPRKFDSKPPVTDRPDNAGHDW